MGNLLFVVSGLFILLWMMAIKGYFLIAANVHLLLLMGFIAAVFGFIELRSVFKRKVNW